ncbi:hypothetical protein [Paracoccus onubensis]|nr:hypothetical protein [Paracoccus onubensis]
MDIGPAINPSASARAIPCGGQGRTAALPLRWMLAIALISLSGAAPAVADAPLIVLDQTQLPFDLGPGHPANNPANPANSPNATWNSAGNTANSPTAWGNRPANPANEKRLIITADGGVLGYYATNAGGVLNLFDVNGRRIAYRPAKGTRSLFTTGGAWCGTVDDGRGGFVIAVTRNCAAKFGG